MEAQDEYDGYETAEDQHGLPSVRPSSASGGDLSSSASSPVASSRFSSRREPFDFGGGAPQCEWEEIPSQRWLARIFGGAGASSGSGSRDGAPPPGAHPSSELPLPFLGEPFHFRGGPPKFEYEEIPARRWLTRVFGGWAPSRRRSDGAWPREGVSGKLLILPEFSFGELATATKNFSPETKIGAGSFGTVYRGKLLDGREVAIKRGESGPRAKKFQEKESTFQSDVAVLSRLHHKHLVGLVGCCEDGAERLLVYDYMKNGALYDHLHPRGATHNATSGDGSHGGVLNSWKMRVKVLLDAARGIEYLHNYAVPPIIHRDIKSSNILLDGNWTAKVSDFGLSLHGPESDGGHLSMTAVGTVGYMDPEYYGLHHLTVKSDVYGLGVVMLEALTGKRPIFKDDDGNPISVVDFAVPSVVEGEVGRVLDPRVGAPGPSEAEAVELLAYTAVHCVSLEGRERPTMTDVVANLESALAL